MARGGKGRKRGGGRGGRGGSRLRPSSGGGGGAGGGDDLDFDKLKESLEEGALAVGKFAKNVLEGSAEVKRAEAAYHNLSSTLELSSLQGAAGLISPGAASFVGGARGLLGQVAAAGNAASELEDVSAQAAFRGMPLDKETQSAIFPLIQARRESVEQARQQAADVSGEQLRGQAYDKGAAFSEFLGIGDVFRGLFGGGNVRTP